MDSQTYTVEEVGEILGIGRRLAYEAVRRGEIPSLRLGRRIVVGREALDELLRSGRQRPASVKRGQS